MKLFSENETYKLYHGDMLDMLDVIEPNSIDAIVTDPPYELNFMNKGWDNSGIAFQKETWMKCYDVLKPGAYLLAFGSPRTFHRIACAIEDAGFEIRDTIMWIFGSGFPKSASIGKMIESKLVNGSGNVKDIKKLDGTTVSVTGGWTENEVDTGKRSTVYDQTKTFVNYKTEEGKKWSGWGTAIKPAYEPVIVARKPCEGSCIANVLKWGVGGYNIEDCRIGSDIITAGSIPKMGSGEWGVGNFKSVGAPRIAPDKEFSVGRFPSNVILTYDESDEQEVCGGFPETTSSGGSGEASVSGGLSGKVYNGGWSHDVVASNLGGLGDSGSAARYFYCAKASRRDRDEGLEEFELKQKYYCDGTSNSLEIFGSTDGGRSPLKNIHPTVKPTDLIQYLIRLVTPPGGTILDPFNGSGSTGKAAVWENRDHASDYSYIGIELNEEYLTISKARLEYAQTCAYTVENGKKVTKEASSGNFNKKYGDVPSMFDDLTD